MAGKTGASKRRSIPQHNLKQAYTKIVTSDTCITCKSQCSRGIHYIRLMEQPGAVGKGVPCILTTYRMHS